MRTARALTILGLATLTTACATSHALPARWLVAAGGEHACAAREGGHRMWCWGRPFGGLGVFDSRPEAVLTTAVPTELPGAAALLVAGAGATCVVTSDGSASCFVRPAVEPGASPRTMADDIVRLPVGSVRLLVPDPVGFVGVDDRGAFFVGFGAAGTDMRIERLESVDAASIRDSIGRGWVLTDHGVLRSWNDRPPRFDDSIVGTRLVGVGCALDEGTGAVTCTREGYGPERLLTLAEEVGGLRSGGANWVVTALGTVYSLDVEECPPTLEPCVTIPTRVDLPAPATAVAGMVGFACAGLADDTIWCWGGWPGRPDPGSGGGLSPVLISGLPTE